MGLYFLRWLFWNGLVLQLMSKLAHGASFYGDSFVHLKLMASSTHTSLHIRFRTSSHDGLLFLAVGQTDYLQVELVSGLLQVNGPKPIPRLPLALCKPTLPEAH
ncbi:hypothetical protein JZ751_001829 [Albula glossodonta]|uniref:Uncharacterized protein n=1 Tax=Albula glossodonta TaxID=121402 RepID=A0A8T2PV63_9TELE|nr:hypothetical protein JZ751_001829 [Albula glossodonta]